jgi:hypothetical protein
MKVDEIRSALEDASRETLADALSILLAEGKAPNQAVAGTDRPELANFAQAVMYLKKNYDFAELDFFTVEADLAYVEAGGRRFLLTERTDAASPAEKEGGKPPDKEEAAFENRGRFSNLEI